MKKEQFEYKEPDELEHRSCYTCHHMDVQDPCMTEESYHCHVFQEEISPFALCSLWKEHDPCCVL